MRLMYAYKVQEELERNFLINKKYIKIDNYNISIMKNALKKFSINKSKSKLINKFKFLINKNKLKKAGS